MLNYLKLISRESCYKQWLSKPRGCLLEISFRLKWNIFISVSCDFLQLFIWYNPKWNSLPVLYHCRHFDRNEISFRVIKHHVNTTRNEIISKENLHMRKQDWLTFTYWAVYLWSLPKQNSFYFARNEK